MILKYIRTKNDDIIVFNDSIQHSEFKRFEPKSAGFISLSVDDQEISCNCYGQSISLNLKSDPEDTALAQKRLFNGY